MSKRVNRLSDEYRSLDRQIPRDYGLPANASGFEIYLLKVVADINPNESGDCKFMIPTKTAPYWYEVPDHTVKLYVPSNGLAVKADDQVLAYWHAAGGVYFPISSPSSASSFLAKSTQQIPARTDQTTPGTATVQPVKYDGSSFVDDGDPVDILSWVSSPSQDPAGGEFYVWIEQGRDGYYYWTGEDCETA